MRLIPAIALVLASGVSATAFAAPTAAPTTAVASCKAEAAYLEAAKELRSEVKQAHAGTINQETLREHRLELEAKLGCDLTLAGTDIRPGDMARVLAARSAFHQQVIRSNEWEAFGATPRPEFGWDPAAQIAQDGKGFGVQVLASARS